MRAVVQRVTSASVTIGGAEHSSIGKGLLILLGIATNDCAADVEYLVHKIATLRIFDDEQGVMNRSVLEEEGEILVVSQFTLLASTKKGYRPSYLRAAREDVALPLYHHFLSLLQAAVTTPVSSGVFGADMSVSLVNDGPVTIILDSQQRDY